MARTNADKRQRRIIKILIGVLVVIIVVVIGFVILVVAAGKNNESGQAAADHMNNAIEHFNNGGGPQGLPSAQNLASARSELAVAKVKLGEYQAGSLTTDEEKELAAALLNEMNAFENLITVTNNIIADGFYYDTETPVYQQAFGAYTDASARRNRLDNPN
jgi:hypothetical protein